MTPAAPHPGPPPTGGDGSGGARPDQAVEAGEAVLFLDIDGVLNCLSTWSQPRVGAHRLDPERIALLNEIVRRTGCLIVASSTWRHGDFAGPKSLPSILREYGLQAQFCPEWRTPDLGHEHSRGEEIARWLSRNPVGLYAIVDDDDDMLPEQMPRFVRTSFERGLTREHADRLIAILSPPTPPHHPAPGHGAGAACPGA